MQFIKDHQDDIMVGSDQARGLEGGRGAGGGHWQGQGVPGGGGGACRCRQGPGAGAPRGRLAAAGAGRLRPSRASGAPSCPLIDPLPRPWPPQVALDYNHSLSVDHEGKVSVHRAGYSQSLGYGDSLRQEIGLLHNAMAAAGPGHEVPPAALEKIFYGNAKKLMDGVKQPAPGAGPGKTGMFKPSAARFLQYLITLQLQDNMRIVGDDAAPKKKDFLPPDLQDVLPAASGGGGGAPGKPAAKAGGARRLMMAQAAHV
jgi:hypothetical protein